jgi:hypothetical protein
MWQEVFRVLHNCWLVLCIYSHWDWGQELYGSFLMLWGMAGYYSLESLRPSIPSDNGRKLLDRGIIAFMVSLYFGGLISLYLIWF